MIEISEVRGEIGVNILDVCVALGIDVYLT